MTRATGEEADFLEWLAEVTRELRAVLLIERHDVAFEKKTAEGHYLSFAFRVPYLDHDIFYSDKFVNQWRKDRRYAKRQIIHELCHAVTDPLYSVACERYVTTRELEHARETVTDHMARIVDELINKGPPL